MNIKVRRRVTSVGRRLLKWRGAAWGASRDIGNVLFLDLVVIIIAS